MNSKRIWSLLLALCMVCLMGIAAAYAEDTACNHTYVTTLLKAPTCEAAGITRYVCSKCNHSYYAAFPAATHTIPTEEGAVTVDKVATCTTTGIRSYTCAVCNKTVTETLPVVGHEFEEKHNAATCTEPEKFGVLCKNCGAEDPENPAVILNPALGHDVGEGEYVAPTCTDAGAIKYVCARNCGYEKVESLGDLDPALGHDVEVLKAVPSTCTKTGLTEGSKCKRENCPVKDGILVAQKEVAVNPNNHDYKEQVVNAATCTTNGIAKKVCDCGKTLGYVTIPAGHKWPDPTKEEDAAFIVPQVLPTCETVGVDVYTCKECGATKAVETPKAHTWEPDAANSKAATCGEAGVKAQKCKKCDATKEEVIPATGDHDFQKETSFGATCTEPAKVGYLCTVCGTPNPGFTATIVGEAMGHDWVAGAYVAADCVKGGRIPYACSRCDETKEELIGALDPALGHLPKAEPALAATCTTTGLTEGSVCQRDNCPAEGKILVAQKETPINPNAHTLTKEVLNAPTCKTTGIGKEVCACGYSGSYVVLPIEHAWGAEDVKGSCDAGWTVTKSCTLCYTVSTEKIAAGHKFSETPNDNLSEDANCGNTGKKVYLCENTDCDKTKEEVIPATGLHIFGTEVTTIDASCTEPAKYGVFCLECGAEDPKNPAQVVEGSEALGHELLSNYTSATCEKGAYVEYVCSRNCGHKETQDLSNLEPATGHKPVVDKGEAATCTLPGLTEGSHCEKCGKVLVAQTVINPDTVNGHKYTVEALPGKEANCATNTNGVGKRVCEECGKVDGYQAIAPEHVWDAPKYENDLAPSCTNDAKATYLCLVCGTTKNETIKGGHVFPEEGIVLEGDEATCGTEGVETFICEREGGCTTDSIGIREEVIPATGEHTFSTVVVENYANCTEPHKIGYFCECGADNPANPSTIVSPALGHTWVMIPGSYIPATCEKGGCTTWYCEVCGETKDEEIGALDPALGHDWVIEPAKPATCASTGTAEYRYCSRQKECGVEPVGGDILPIDPNNHKDKDEVIKPATCTTSGIAKVVCEYGCGKSSGYKTIAPQHDWDETVITAATCTSDGKSEFVCKVCSNTKTEVTPGGHIFATEEDAKGYDWTWDDEYKSCGYETEKRFYCMRMTPGGAYCYAMERAYTSVMVPATGEHSAFEVNTTYATCTEPGLAGYLCVSCGKDDPEHPATVTAPAKGHDWVDLGIYEAATCEEGGYTTLLCFNCGEEDKKYIDIDPALGHTPTKLEAVEATCVTPGLTEGSYCSACGKELVKQELIPADPNGSTAHKWTNEIVKAATCDKNGIAKVVCEYGCEATKGYVTIPAAHTWIEPAEVITPATCTTTGLQKLTCGVCGFIKNEVLPAAHDWEKLETVEAGCGNDGYESYFCKTVGCTETKKENIKEATGNHTFAPAEKPATCTEPFTAGSFCTGCGLKNPDVDSTTVGEPNGHSWVQVGDYNEPTCDKGGYYLYICEACETEKTEEVELDPATGHNYELVEGVPATCKNVGLADAMKCTICGQYETEPELIPVDANAHVWVVNALPGKEASCTTTGIGKKECSECGASAGYVVIDFAHVWNMDVVVDFTVPTCTEDGEMIYKCYLCEATTSEVWESEGHDYVAEVTVATCAKDGKTVYTCLECEDTYTEVIPATGVHIYKELIQNATCTEPAMVGAFCEVCGAEDPENPAEVVDGSVALGHKWVEGAHVAASCEKPGYVPYLCENCGETYEELLTELEPALGHKPEELKAVAATCTTPGLTAGEKCKVCGETLVEQELVPVDPTAHNHKEEYIKEPTCATSGIAKLVCACGDSKGYVTVPASHKWNDGVADPDATCVKDGVKKFACTVEGCGATKQEAIPATGKHTFGEEEYREDDTGRVTVYKVCTVCKAEEIIYTEGCIEHVEVEIPAVDPTCTETGLTAGKKCSVCGDILAEQEEIAALGHTEEDLEAVEPTCTETGLTAGKKCTVCEEITVEQEEVPALGHTEEELKAVEPTCTETGLTAGKKCTVCEEITVEQEEVAALGHDYQVVEGSAVAPTCTTVGYEAKSICALCEDEKAGAEIAVLPHTEEVVAGKAATCTETGLTEGKVCSVCDTVLAEQEVIAVLPHTEEVVAGKAATCTETGLTEGKVCSVCDTVLAEQEVIEAAGHTEEVVAGKDATCTVAGLTEGKVCSVCDAVLAEQKEIPATGKHDYKDVEGTATGATCTTAGKEADQKCSTCGDVKTGAVIETLAHNYTSKKSFDENGDLVITYTCTVCGDSYVK